MSIAAQDSVTVSRPQLHGNCSVIEQGQVVAVKGRIASVILAGAEVPMDFPVSSLTKLEDSMGYETTANHFQENQVIDAIRRR